MRNISHHKKWNTGTVQFHIEPHPIPLIKINNDEKLDIYFVKIQLCRGPTLENSDLYEFKITLFDNVKLEEFLFLVCKFNMNLQSSGTLKSGVNIQYLRIMIHV